MKNVQEACIQPRCAIGEILLPNRDWLLISTAKIVISVFLLVTHLFLLLP